jgi:autotransporter-associated beta strand protein
VAINTTLLSLGTGNAAATVGSGGARIDSAGFNVTIPQALLSSGAGQDGGLTKLGAGTLTLTGTNTYTGNTTVSAGTLDLTQPTLAVASTVTVANGALLQLDFAVTNQVKALVLNGVSQPAGLYSASTSSFISGTGSLLVQPIASNPTNVTYSLSGSTLHLSWPADHLGWILQQQTNSTSIGLSNNWVDVAGSSSVTSATITVNPAVGTAFYRLRHP